MAHSFTERLRAGAPIVADGATGTNLQRRGLPPGAPPEEWVLDRPDEVLGLQRAFVDAGAQIILTCTFGGSGVLLASSRYAGRAAEINRRAVTIARQAAAGRPDVLVAGSIGPTGKFLEPLGDLPRDAAVATFAEQAGALAEAGADLLVIETMYALDEALAAVEGARQACALPLVVSFSYEKGGRTMMGLRPAETVAALAPLGVAAIGTNCGLLPDGMESIVAELAASGLPVWAKPNAGLPEGDPPRYTLRPEELAATGLRLLASGARVVGGCCGTAPEHIAALARAVRDLPAGG